MNEPQFGNRMRQLIKRGEPLDASILARLRAARETALAHQKPELAQGMTWTGGLLARAGGFRGLSLRLIVPLLALAIGLAAVYSWEQRQRAAESETTRWCSGELPIDAHSTGVRAWLKARLVLAAAAFALLGQPSAILSVQRQPPARRTGTQAGAQAPAGYAASKPAGQAPKKGPAWAELNAEHQQILAPLKDDWENIVPDRRRNWINLAKRYPKMKPEEQQRMQRRMQSWAQLTPEQRKQARENYRRLSKVPPEKRGDLKQQWSEYQALPPQERQNAAAKKKPAPAK
jgi:hypothetical protein